MNKPRIAAVEKNEWLNLVTAEVTAAVRESVESNDGCSLMLTGGNTAKGLMTVGLLLESWLISPSATISEMNDAYRPAIRKAIME
jgi:hypothetical protein